MATDTAADIASGVLLGLCHIHSRHIIHADLSPSNILLTDDKALVADFGTSLSVAAAASSDVEHAVTTRTVASPELMSGGKPSQSADMWAFAQNVYLLLVGDLSCRQKQRRQEGTIDMRKAV